MMVIPIAFFLYTLVLVSFNNMIGAYVQISQLRVRGTTSSFAINKPLTGNSQQPSSPILRKQTISCWRRRTKALHSSTKDKSSSEDILVLAKEEERDDIYIEDTSYQLEMGSTNSTNSNNIISESSPSAQLFGIPIQSVILLNLVAVIWGTQHAVIKGVLSSGKSAFALSCA